MYNYSKRSYNLKSSEIRDILKLTEQPSVISFAGGLPAPELFPDKEILEVTNDILTNIPRLALQYTSTQGYYNLRKQICDYNMSKVGVSTLPDNILLTNGSQQAIEFTSKLFLNPNDSIICERPSYLGAINAFKSYEANMLEASLEPDGINVEEVEELLKSNGNVKLIYTIPDSQNPTGVTMSLKKRKALAELASKYNVLILEDCPYAEVTYENDILPSIQSFNKTGHVVHLGSFSKILCPGLRIGWISASEELIAKYIMIKQSSDLQCNTLSQLQISKYMERYDIDEHISKINALYKSRRNLMVEHLQTLIPNGVKFNIPKGGLFIWLELNESINTSDLLHESLEKKVAFVIGRPFFANTPKDNFLRLNYSNMPETQIIEGVRRLSEIINSYY